MKNLLYILSIVCSLAILSCSSDDAGSPISPDIDLVDENLVGEWKLIDFEVTNGTVQISGMEIPFTVEGSNYETDAIFTTNPNNVSFSGTFNTNTNFITPVETDLPLTREDMFDADKIFGGTSELNNWSLNEGDTVIAGSQAKIIKFTKEEIQYELELAQSEFATVIEEGFDLNGFKDAEPKGQIIITLVRK